MEFSSLRKRALFAIALPLVVAALCAAGAAAPPAHQPARVVDVRAQNEPVRQVLLRVARATGAGVTIGDGVTGYVTVELHKVTLTQALHAILDPVGATFQLRNGVYDVERTANSGAPAGGSTPVVIPLSVVGVKRAAATLRPLFPGVTIAEDTRANALLAVGTPSDVQAMRAVLQGIDVRDPGSPVTEAVAVHGPVQAQALAGKLRAAFPDAKFIVAGARQLLVTARPLELNQIKPALAALDAAGATPPPAAAAAEAVPVLRRAPRDVARSLAAQVPGLRAAVSGSTVLLSGPPDAVARAKALIAQLDIPSFGEKYTQVYRIKTLDAASVADLLRRSFRDLDVTVDASLNAIAVTATAAQQQRIADAVAQLGAPPAGSPGALLPGSAGGSNGSTEVVTLKSFVPGQGQGGTDAVASFTQALQIVTPDVRVIQLPTPGQIALVGPPASVRSARDFIDKVDVVAPLVVLDTEVLEVDETVAKNLGLQLGTAAISTTFSEMQPLPNRDGTPTRLGQFQALTRTPISFTAQLNLLVQNGKGRVLADPRITTLSGRTASIRAGDTISILTTTAGNAGTIATTQVQSFQTGVTLDITPSVTPDGGITVVLHPVVNSLIGTNAGVPEISTRDTQTTVHLQDDETLVIGGLIQENDTRTTTKVPFLGDVPIVGRVFRNENVQGQRNELIIVVTPHVVKPGTSALPGPPIRAIPRPSALPTLPPNTHLPPPSGQLPAARTPGTSALPVAATTPAPAAGTGVPAPAPANPVQTPAPSPSAFAQTNVFTFGSPPQSNFAKPSDPVQIFYATLSPTVVANGTSVHIAVVTTTNASAVKLKIGTETIGLSQTGVGQWQATFPFPATAVPTGETTMTTTLIASRSDGTSSSVPIALSLTRP
jgi:type II secretory pathway component GspD/PulD (secretin)